MQSVYATIAGSSGFVKMQIFSKCNFLSVTRSPPIEMSNWQNEQQQQQRGERKSARTKNEVERDRTEERERTTAKQTETEKQREKPELWLEEWWKLFVQLSKSYFRTELKFEFFP